MYNSLVNDLLYMYIVELKNMLIILVIEIYLLFLRTCVMVTLFVTFQMNHDYIRMYCSCFFSRFLSVI